MHTPDSIQSTLSSPAGFAALHGKGLFGGRARKSYTVWNAAEARGVQHLHKVRDDAHEGFSYGIFVFAPGRELSDEELAGMTEAGAGIDLGLIRYESLSYSHLQRIRGNPGSAADENNEIAAAVACAPDVAVMTIPGDRSDRFDFPMVVWARTGDVLHTYPVPLANLDAGR